MPKVNNIYQKYIIKNIVDNAIISHPNTITIPAF